MNHGQKRDYEIVYTNGKRYLAWGYIHDGWGYANMKWPRRWEITHLATGRGIPGFATSRDAARRLIDALNEAVPEMRDANETTPEMKATARFFLDAYVANNPREFCEGNASLLGDVWVINALEEVVA